MFVSMVESSKDELREASKRYAGYMHEIKNRLKAVSKTGMSISEGKPVLGFHPIAIEICFLNFRKIIELMFYACASAHADLGVEISRRISSREWNARRIMRELERVNPKFYPVPIESLSPEGETIRRTTGFLEKEECLKLYDEICGSILHASRELDWYARDEYGLAYINDWHNQLYYLLAHHWVELKDDISFAVILFLKDSDNIQVAPMQRVEK